MVAKHTFVFSVDSSQFPNLPAIYDQWKQKKSLSYNVNRGAEMLIQNKMQTKIDQFNKFAAHTIDDKIQSKLETINLNQRVTKKQLDEIDYKELLAIRHLMEKNLFLIENQIKSRGYGGVIRAHGNNGK